MKFARSGWTFAQVPIWTICDPRLSDGALRLFAYLAWRQGNDAYCWPSISTICRDLHTSPTTARRRLRELAHAGYLKITHRTGRSNHYALHADPHSASDTYTPPNNGIVSANPSQECQGTPTIFGRGGTESDRGPLPTMAGGSTKSDRGPLPKLTGRATKSGTHDDKIEQQKQDKEKEDISSSLWTDIQNTIRSTMTCDTFTTHWHRATAELADNVLTISLPSYRSFVATQRQHSWLARAITAHHNLEPRFVAPS